MVSLIGRTLGQYKVESLLDSGGMGDVYRGSHLLINRAVAIKILHANLAANSDLQSRFKQEAMTAAALVHPNIISIYDFGVQEEADGDAHNALYYLVMELVTTGSLRGLLQSYIKNKQTLPLPLSLDLMRQTAEGLAFAHDKGVVHRDIKPDNLLIATQGAPSDITTPGRAVVKITDFGLARLAEGLRMTATGQTMGTPTYMSPEQCKGLDLDGRSDVYSLGIVLYELSTGYVPFGAKTISEAVYQHVNAVPQPPRSVRPDLPEQVETIILRCLAKEPNARFNSARQLAASLRAALNDPRLTQLSNDLTRVSSASPGADAKTVAQVRQPLNPISSTGQSTTFSGAGNSSGSPILRVQTQDKQEVFSAPLTETGLTLGRAPDNTIALPSTEISRYHARFDWNGRQVTVTDLGSSNGTFLGTVRLTPQSPQIWDGAQPLGVGPYWLKLRMPDRVGAQPAGPAAPHGGHENNQRSSRISIGLTATTLVLVPGQLNQCAVTMKNLGTLVDHFTLSVEGVSAEWLQPIPDVMLNPGKDETVWLRVLVPKLPSSRAGERAVVIRVRSTDTGEFNLASMNWSVQPFADVALDISPKRAGGLTQASYGLKLTNTSNMPLVFGLGGGDDERKLSYTFSREGQIWQSANQSQGVHVEPGEVAPLTLKVGANRRWIGSAQLRPFWVEALSPETGAKRIPAQFDHGALIPVWVPPLVLLMLIGACALLYSLIWHGPTLLITKMDPPVPIAGQPVTVTWDVSNDVNTVTFLPMGEVVNARDHSHVFPNGLPANTQVKLRAENAFGTAEQPVVSNVLVPTPIPPTATPEPGAPGLEILEPAGGTITINPGENVTIRWKATNAESVEFDGDTAQLEDARLLKPNQSRKYQIVAFNKAGKSFKASVEVILIPPSPTPTAVPPSATPTVIPTPDVPQVICCTSVDGANSEGVRVRSGPGLAFEHITTLTPGTVVTVIGHSPDNQWWKVKLSGSEGWLMAQYVNFGGNLALVPAMEGPTPTPPPTDVPTTEPATDTPATDTPPPPSAPAVVVDMLTDASGALWRSGQLLPDGNNTTNDMALPWNGSNGDKNGFVRLETHTLESGDTQLVLETHPQWVSNGTIKGWFRNENVTLTAHAYFAAEVGFVAGGTATDGVTFQVWEHHTENGQDRWSKIAEVSKHYTGSLVPIHADLSHLAGQQIYIELRVDAGASSAQDWAVWANPRLVLEN